MPRLARIVVPGIPHHITQRGNNRQDVFFTDDDRVFFLRTLRERCAQYRLKVLAYCLMTNHYHLVAVPRDSDSLAKGIGKTNDRYASCVNRLHGRSGHLWQGRYFSIPLDEGHMISAMCYVERNPVCARMVESAVEYRWSSAAAHCGRRDESGLLDVKGWACRFPPEGWAERLGKPGDPSMRASLRRRAFNGRPLGSDDFIARLEAKLGRRLRPQKVGRPQKKGRRVG